MKILITGHAGFIGKNLCFELAKKGHIIAGIDLCEFELPGILSYKKDISELKELNNIDVIVHLAAFGGVPNSLKDPNSYFDNNIKKFNNLLELARSSGIKRFIFASSSSVKQLKSPYAATKKCNEIVANTYFNAFGMETIGLRFHNVIGKYQRPNTVL